VQSRSLLASSDLACSDMPWKDTSKGKGGRRDDKGTVCAGQILWVRFGLDKES
jgi:hypothetical protein